MLVLHNEGSTVPDGIYVLFASNSVHLHSLEMAHHHNYAVNCLTSEKYQSIVHIISLSLYAAQHGAGFS